MSSLRADAPKAFGEYKVAAVGDYLDGTVKNLKDGSVTATGQPSSDVLYYTLENDDKIIVRPSGTEPKIKIYVLAHHEDRDVLNEKIKIYTDAARNLADI